jgi:hypothetical protein
MSPGQVSGSGELDTWQCHDRDIACLGKHQGKARDDVMNFPAIHKTSKALLETMEHRRTDPRQALEGQGHGKY